MKVNIQMWMKNRGTTSAARLVHWMRLTGATQCHGNELFTSYSQ